jgi:hypothetical protein
MSAREDDGPQRRRTQGPAAGQRWRRASGAALGMALASLTACTDHQPARFPTASKLPDDERRPDGIAVDLTSDPPPYQDRAEADAGIVTLRTPLGTPMALETVRLFFEAMVGEDVSAMSLLMGPNATSENTGAGSNRRSTNITNMWRERFRKREYQKLATQAIYRETDVTTYRRDQLAALPLAVRLRTSTRPQGAANDLVLRIPIITHTVKNERLLGDEIFIWLERRGHSFVIARTAENIPF